MVSAQVDGLIIVDESGKAIVQTSFHNAPAAYPLLHLDAFNQAREKARTGTTNYPKRCDPVLVVNIPASADRTSSVCCHVERGGISFLCPVSSDVDPSFVFAFLEVFIGILDEYLGGVSSSLIKDHFDVVYQLLEEMLDNGIPLTTEPNTLRDIVLPPSLLNKMLSVAGVAGLPTSTPAPFSSPIPWRKAGLRYNNNEIYFDLVETLDAVVSNAGKVLHSEIHGRIQSNSHLSGTPDILMSLANSQLIADPTFHPCIRFGRFMSKKELSFVPPDGPFTLMGYRVDRPSGSGIGAGAGAGVPIPLALKPSLTLTEDGGQFEITLTSRLPSSRTLENVRVTLYLGTGAGSVSATIGLGISSMGQGSGGVVPGKGRAKEGGWGWDPRTHELSWDVPVLDSHPRSIKGTFLSSDRPPRPSRSGHASFQLPSDSLSGIRVEHMKVTKESYTAYKGVRYSAKGEIEWRL